MDSSKTVRKIELCALEWYESLVFAILVMVLLFSFFFRIIQVSGDSMLPTLQDYDRLIVWGAGYVPESGDVIVVDGDIDYGKAIVKRIIAQGGDEVNIDFQNGIVTVNGEVLEEDYILEPTTLGGDVEFPLVVPEGTVFVLGDNRNNSSDSRVSQIGFIDVNDILGKVVLRLFPLSEIGVIE